MRALLDVNVLIALHDSNHIHHAEAARWLQTHAEQGWASCPLTQNGYLRIMGQPGYANPQPLPILTAMLAQSTATRFHQFCPTTSACSIAGTSTTPTSTARAS